jgi:hypothetical protein
MVTYVPDPLMFSRSQPTRVRSSRARSSPSRIKLRSCSFKKQRVLLVLKMFSRIENKLKHFPFERMMYVRNTYTVRICNPYAFSLAPTQCCIWNLAVASLRLHAHKSNMHISRNKHCCIAGIIYQRALLHALHHIGASCTNQYCNIWNHCYLSMSRSVRLSYMKHTGIPT